MLTPNSCVPADYANSRRLPQSDLLHTMSLNEAKK
jgi:hypothetical protein